MADDLNKKGPSSVPPPTDEIDQDWGTARSAPTHGKPVEEEEDDDAGEDEDEDTEDEGDEEEDDEEEDEDDDAEAAAAPRSGVAPHTASPDTGPRSAEDSLPDWVPWVVLAALVSAGIAGALGAFSGT